MQKLRLQNPNVMKILSYLDEFVIENLDLLNERSKQSPQKKDIVNSFWQTPYKKEYLDIALQKPDLYQFPAHSYGTGVMQYIGEESLDDQTVLMNKVQELSEFLGAPRNALAMYYPAGGYIGWHHNGNASGYNILFSWSQTGESKFSYYDYENNSVVDMQDDKGWNVKAGFYPAYKSKEDVGKVYWHAADTQCPRLTVAFIINNEILWQDMIDEVEDPC